jgi:DMSO/TMAO reductase YedYZ heme-binding membrane subunit
LVQLIEVFLAKTKPPRDEDSISRVFRATMWIGLFVAVYTTVRLISYGIQSSQLPLLVVNKSCAYIGAVLLALCLGAKVISRIAPTVAINVMIDRKYYGIVGFGAALIHMLFSVILLRPINFPALFLSPEDGGLATDLSLVGQLMLVAGTISLVILGLLSLTSIDSVRLSMGASLWRKTHAYASTALWLALLHIGLTNGGVWVRQSIDGYMPPLTSFIFGLVLVVVMLRIVGRQRALIHARRKKKTKVIKSE